MRLLAIIVLATALAGCDDDGHEQHAPPPAETARPRSAVSRPAAPQTAEPSDGAALPVTGITLFAGGTARIVHEGTVNGRTTVALQFRPEQVSGVVKSLTVTDEDPSAAMLIRPPDAATTRSSRLDLAGNPTLAELLQQLRGVAAKITRGGETLDVTILSLEKKDKNEHWQINVMVDGGIRSLSMDGIQRIELTDARARDELKRAVRSLWNSGETNERATVHVELGGSGQRRVRLSYTLPMQAWKASYRLTLGDRPVLQAWASVTNDTDSDWKDVPLVLAGSQPLVLSGSAAMDAAAVSRAAKASGIPAGEPLREPRPLPSRAAIDQRDAAPAAPRMRWQEQPAPPLRDPDAFRHSVSPLSVPKRGTAVVPLLNAPVSVERLAVYSESLLRRNALLGARLRNTTAQYLPHGPLTVIDGQGLGGETVLDNLPPGRWCLISWGIDLTMLVDASDESLRIAPRSGRIENGVLSLVRRHTYTKRYVVQNEQREDRLLVVEHPIRRGWALAEPDEVLDITESVYRLGLTVPGGEKRTLTVREQIDEAEEIELLAAETDGLAGLARDEALPRKVREAITEVIAARARIAEEEQQASQLAARVNGLSAEQSRLSQTIETMPERSPARDRLRAQFEQTESLLVELNRNLARAVAEAERLRTELRGQLSSLNVTE